MSEQIPPGTAKPTGIPRWVKIFAIAAVVLVLLFLVVHLAGGGMGNHSPS